MLEQWKGQSVASRSATAVLSIAASLAVAGCSSTIGFDDPFADYLQRTPLVSTTGGDAQAANIALQTPTPWPRTANDTNIPANGARMAAAIKRYASGSTGASDGGAQTSMSPGANPGAANNGPSTGMTASPSPPPSAY